MVDRYLVDTGVFVRWYIDQPGYLHARSVRDDFLQGVVGLETVDNIRVEVGAVLRNRGLLPGALTAEDYIAAVRSIDDLGVTVHLSDANSLERVADLCARRSISFYDGLLVDRALRDGLTLLTADGKLTRAVAGLISTELLVDSQGNAGVGHTVTA